MKGVACVCVFRRCLEMGEGGEGGKKRQPREDGGWGGDALKGRLNY